MKAYPPANTRWKQATAPCVHSGPASLLDHCCAPHRQTLNFSQPAAEAAQKTLVGATPVWGFAEKSVARSRFLMCTPERRCSRRKQSAGHWRAAGTLQPVRVQQVLTARCPTCGPRLGSRRCNLCRKCGSVHIDNGTYLVATTMYMHSAITLKSDVKSGNFNAGVEMPVRGHIVLESV